MTCSPHHRAWQIACGAWQGFYAAFKEGTSPANQATDLTQAISNSLAFLLYASRDLKNAIQWFKQKMTERAARKNAENKNKNKNKDENENNPDDDVEPNYTEADANRAIEQDFPDPGANPSIPDPPVKIAGVDGVIEGSVEGVEAEAKTFDFFAHAVPILGEAMMIIGVVAMIIGIFIKKKKPSCTTEGTINAWVNGNVNPWLAKHQMPYAAWTENVRCAGAA